MNCFESCTRLKANTVARRGNSGGRRGWHEYEFSRSQKWTILTEIDQAIIRTFYDWEAWISAITDTETRCQTDPVRFANNFYYKSTTHNNKSNSNVKFKSICLATTSKRADPIFGLQHVEEYFAERPWAGGMDWICILRRWICTENNFIHKL